MGKRQGVPKPALDVSLAQLPSINYQVSDNRGTIRLPPNQAIVGHLTYVSIVSLDAPFPFLITPPHLPILSLDSYAWPSLPIYNAIALIAHLYTDPMWSFLLRVTQQQLSIRTNATPNPSSPTSFATK